MSRLLWEGLFVDLLATSSGGQVFYSVIAKSKKRPAYLSVSGLNQEALLRWRG